MNFLVAELIGTMILVLLGNGVIANVLLSNNKGQGGGGGGAWITIAAGWGFALAMGVYAVGWASGAHLNPAVTFGFLAIGQLEIGTAILYIIGQFIGAFIGAVLVWLAYFNQFQATTDANLKLAVFSTGPEIPNYGWNLVTEAIGAFMLVFGIMGIINANNGAGGVAPLAIGFLLFGIGLSLGGPTGFSVNPARDLGPRIAHLLLPIPAKRDSDWGYAWVPVVGPIIGGIIAGILYQLLVSPLPPLG